jgi:tetrahydromethanopterin S-methyltransferase subunit G
MDPDVIRLLTLIGGFAAIGAMGTLAHAAAKRIRGDAGSSEITSRLEETEQRLADAEARIDELSRAEERLEELDERMEFAERLLQQQRDRERLPPGD